MEKVSKITFFAKKIFPLLLFILSVALFLIFLVNEIVFFEKLIFLTIFSFCTVISFFVYFFAQKLVDSVKEFEDYLLICRGQTEIKICTDEIKNVHYINFTSPPLMTFGFKNTTQLGDKVYFIPKLGIINMIPGQRE